MIIGTIILGDREFVRRHTKSRIRFVMVAFLLLTCVSFCLFGFILGIWATGWEKLTIVPTLDHHAADVSGRHVLLDQHAAAGVADHQPVQPGGLPRSAVFAGASTSNADVSVGLSLGMTSRVPGDVSAVIVRWIFKTGYQAAQLIYS